MLHGTGSPVETRPAAGLRVVVVMPEPPLPFGNASARWYYVLLRGLVDRGHRVTAFAACTRPGDVAEAAALFPAPRYDLRCYPHVTRAGLRAKWETVRQPLSYIFSPALRRDLRAEMARGADVLHLEQQWSGWLGLPYARRAVMNVHYLTEIDLAGLPRDSAANGLRRALVRRAERRLLRRYPTIWTFTSRLSARVRELNPSARVHTIPLGMDLSLYPFEGDRRPGDRPVVGLIGSFDWYPTRTAAIRLVTRLWPAIKHRIPAARLKIVGRWARAQLEEFLQLPDVDIRENVPETLPYFRSTDVMLYAPTQGSGMKVKVLEAFALGVPVVTTPDGVEGIAAEDGVHAGICEDDAGLIARCVALLGDPERARQQRAAARALLEATCSPAAAVAAVEGVYATMHSLNGGAGESRS